MNEIEIVITSRNRARPAVEEAKRDAKGLSTSYKDVGKAGTTAFGHIRDALRGGLHDAIADVHGETNRISRAFRQVQVDVTRSMDQVKANVKSRLSGLLGERDGRSAGRRLVAGIAGAVKDGAGFLKSTFSSVFQGGLKGTLSTPVIGPIILGLLGVVAGSLSGVLATLISGGLVLGVGGAVAGIGVALLAQDKKVKQQWSATWKELKGVMTDAAKPLLPVMETARKAVKSVVKDLAPEIEKGFETAQKPLQRFIRFVGDGFKELKPAIAPLFASFSAILDELGPQLPGLFEDIAGAFTSLSNTMADNSDVFAAVFTGLLAAIPLVLNGLNLIITGFRVSLSIVADVFDGISVAIQGVLQAIADIPGPWQASARAAIESIQNARDRMSAWKRDIENFPKKVQLKGEIRDLNSKLASARRQLKDPNLTRTRRAKLEAKIDQLLRAKARAQHALDSLRNRTVYVDMIRRDFGIQPQTGVPWAPQKDAHGGIIGGLGAKRFATGGISGGSMAMVGEQGPELVKLPFGSTVMPAGQTKAMLSNPATSGFNSISMAFRAGGGAGGLAGAAEPLKEVAAALREIVSLRDGFEKLTGNVFGQTRALMAYEEAWDAARKSLKENGRTLNITKEKGRENRSTLLSLAEAAQEVVVAMRAKGSSIATVTKKMAEQRAEFIRMAKLFGLTSRQARAMADRLGLIPKKVKTILEVERRDIAYNKKIEKAQAGKASGGIAGGMTWVGERGPELVNLPFGSQVTSAGQSRAMAAGSAQPITVVLEIRSGGGTDFDQFMTTWIRKSVRVKGGGSAQVAFGQRGR